MTNFLLSISKKIKTTYFFVFFLIFFVYFTFSITNIYFNALAGADNYKYFQNILFVYGESENTFDNQGLLYYFLIAFLLSLRTSSFNYNDNINTIFKSDSVLLSETILITNLLIFICGLIGFYYLMKKLKIAKNKSLIILILLVCFPSLYYLRLNMKPEILAFALLPWIFYFLEIFLESNRNILLVNISILLSILVLSKGSIAAMVLACLFTRFIVNYKLFSFKQILIGFGSLVIALSLITIENNILGIGNLLERKPEQNYNFKAPSNIVYNLDTERLLKDPKKNYHRDSLVGITLIDLTGDYFELNWKEDSVLFSKNIKPLIVSTDRDLDNENLKLFNLDTELKNIVYSGPGQNYTIYYLRYLNILLSIFFIFLTFKYFFKEKIVNKAYLIFPFIGVFVLLINTIFGFPQNNFDPSFGDTYKVFYYSFLIPFTIIVVLKNINIKNFKNIIFVIVFLLFTFVNLGFPKSNNEKLDLELKESIENTIFCELNKNIIENSFITEVKVQCIDQNVFGPIKTNIKKVPFFSLFLLFLSSALSFISLKKMESKIFKFFVNQNIFYSLIGKIYFKKYNFKIIKQYKIDALWGEFVCSNSMEVPIENLFPILNSANGYEKIQIENSPHFKLIKSYEQKQKLDISDYIDYYTEYFPNENIEEKIQKFIDLFNNLSDDNSRLFVCVKKEASSFKDANFKILDGLHRISIAKALNIKIIKVYIVDSIKNY